MLLQSENWIKGYNQIVADCRPQNPFSGNAGTVLILCNLDADALCAARILSYILRADNVPYQLRPCGGMSKLISILESLNLYSPSSSPDNAHGGFGDNDTDSDEDHDNNGSTFNGYNSYSNSNSTVSNSAIRAIILLNLGATKNLNSMLYSPRRATANKLSTNATSNIDENHNNDKEEFLPPLVSNLIKTFVLDSHRPYHLANIHAGKNIVIWNDYDDWHQDEGGIPSDGDGLSGDEDDDEDSEEEDDDDESDSDEIESDNEESGDEGEAEFEDDEFLKDDGIQAGPEAVDNQNGSLKRNQDEGLDTDTDDDDNDVSPMRAKRQRQENPDTPDTAKMTDDDQDEQEHLDEGDDDESLNNEKATTSISKDQVDVVQSIREQHELRRNKIRRYYDSGSFHSSPVSFMVYELSTVQRHGSVGDLLWLACVGVTDAYIHNRLDLSGYYTLSRKLQRRVRETYNESNFFLGNVDDNIHQINQRLNNSFYAEDLYTNDRGFGEDMNLNQRVNRQLTQVGLSENGRILIQEKEFRFFLLRHVSLWDAIVLSSEVNTKMELWKNKGVKKLQEMLAKMGVPLNQCQQPFAFMKPSLKRRLRSMIFDHSHEYGLDNLSYTGFVRVTGYKSLLSASDVAYAVTALLECETNGNDRDQLSNLGDYREYQNRSKEEEKALINSFNNAYDALNSNGSSGGEGTDLLSIVNGGDSGGNINGIGSGIRLAVTLQSAIVNTAISLVERKAIIRLSHFRYAYLHATSQGANGGNNFNTSNALSSHNRTNQNHSHIFAKPLALTKLAHFLMDMHRTNKKWTGTKARPLLLLAEKPQSETYLVVGYEFPDERGTVKRNKFKKNFKLATDTLKGSFRYDSFESNVVEVNASDVQQFIEHLHYMIDSV